jgi:hypothetical protein
MSHSLPTSALSYHQPIVNATTRAIELALHKQSSDGDNRLRETIRQLCTDARRLSVRPEELIVLFKMGWRAHADLQALPRDEANTALDRVITMCIDEYYRGGLSL